MPQTLTLPIDPNSSVVQETVKVTTGYFTGGAGKLMGTDIYTGSIDDGNKAYYVNLTQVHPDSSSAETQFSVAYGHIDGSGSFTDSDQVVGASELIYKQWGSFLLSPTAITGGFHISSGEEGTTKPTNSKVAAGTKDSDIYVLVGKRSRFKDRINKGNWTIALSGSVHGPGEGAGNWLGDHPSGSDILKLTDDSKISEPTITAVGHRYNIVSGALGVVSGSGASDRTYGWIYPDVGVMVFSQAELSSSIPGPHSQTANTASWDSYGSASNVQFSSFMNALSSSGMAAVTSGDFDARNHIRFANCLSPAGAYLQFRGEEDQNSVSYFCRVHANQMNFTNNPTFISGSQNLIRNESMRNDPNVYITGVNLYSNDGTLVATAKLSTPIKKNFGSEATIKVKLTY